jgi:hypothetical protein
LDGPYPLLVLLASAPRGAPLPLPRGVEATVQAAPVDFVAKAAFELAALPAAIGKTVHVVDRHAISVGHLLELTAKRFGVPLDARFTPRALGRALFGNPGIALVAQNLRGVIELITNPARYDDRLARELLVGPDGACPPLDSYLDALLSHVAARVAEKRLSVPSHKEPHHVAS